MPIRLWTYGGVCYLPTIVGRSFNRDPWSLVPILHSASGKRAPIVRCVCRSIGPDRNPHALAFRD